MYEYEDQDGKHFITRAEILEEYYSYWCTTMRALNRDHLISEDRCVEDFCTVHWAYKIVV